MGEVNCWQQQRWCLIHWNPTQHDSTVSVIAINVWVFSGWQKMRNSISGLTSLHFLSLSIFVPFDNFCCCCCLYHLSSSSAPTYLSFPVHSFSVLQVKCTCLWLFNKMADTEVLTVCVCVCWFPSCQVHYHHHFKQYYLLLSTYAEGRSKKDGNEVGQATLAAAAAAAASETLVPPSCCCCCCCCTQPVLALLFLPCSCLTLFLPLVDQQHRRFGGVACLLASFSLLCAPLAWSPQLAPPSSLLSLFSCAMRFSSEWMKEIEREEEERERTCWELLEQCNGSSSSSQRLVTFSVFAAVNTVVHVVVVEHCLRTLAFSLFRFTAVFCALGTLLSSFLSSRRILDALSPILPIFSSVVCTITGGDMRSAFHSVCSSACALFFFDSLSFLVSLTSRGLDLQQQHWIHRLISVICPSVDGRSHSSVVLLLPLLHSSTLCCSS